MKIKQTTTVVVTEYVLEEEVDAEVYPLDDPTPITTHTKKLRVSKIKGASVLVEAWWHMADRWAEVTPGSEQNLLSRLEAATR